MTTADTLAAYRRFFAEEIETVAGVQNPRLIEAFATVPRERFLPPGPWTIRTDADVGRPPRLTPDADPCRIYHNVGVALDAGRELFNGWPTLLALCLDQLGIDAGRSVLHVGCGSGYYTAIIAHAVGPTGRVKALEVDEGLAAQARTNLAATPWVDVQCDDGRDGSREPVDAILVNAGVTHPHASWLDALTPGGRLVLPLTVPISATRRTIGKGVMLAVVRDGSTDEFAARLLTYVSIYNAVGLRDAVCETRLSAAMARNPFAPITRLRRDPHEEGSACWLHGDRWCFTTG